MDFNLLPFGDIWQSGMVNVPAAVIDKYIRMASEYQLKALLLVIRNGGKSSSAQIGKALGLTAGEVEELCGFWLDEGVLTADGEAPASSAPVTAPEPEKEVEAPPIQKKEVLPPPRLSPSDIVALLREDKSLEFLLNQAQVVLGRTIAHNEQELLINMANYYGLKPEIILMILEFYRAEKQRGKSISLAYINKMAMNWSEEGIETLADAEEKLRDIERSNRLWNEITALTGIKHKNPTLKQREMIKEWYDSFDLTMITLAADMMKENTPQPSLPYINTILKKWKKLGITSPAEVQAQQEQFAKSKKDKADGKLQVKPTYNLDEVKKNAMDNTEI